MKKHKNLKELLLDYENEKDQMYNRPVGIDQDDEMFIHYYVSNNCLVSGKQRPLAKNKQCDDDLCNCKSNHEFMLTDGDSYCCCGCKKPIA